MLHDFTAAEVGMQQRKPAQRIVGNDGDVVEQVDPFGFVPAHQGDVAWLHGLRWKRRPEPGDHLAAEVVAHRIAAVVAPVSDRAARCRQAADDQPEAVDAAAGTAGMAEWSA
ncbi:hypothetical protein D9M68_933060 [compost metagenome]